MPIGQITVLYIMCRLDMWILTCLPTVCIENSWNVIQGQNLNWINNKWERRFFFIYIFIKSNFYTKTNYIVYLPFYEKNKQHFWVKMKHKYTSIFGCSKSKTLSRLFMFKFVIITLSVPMWSDLGHLSRTI